MPVGALWKIEVYVTDAALVQSSCRSLIVDTLPIPKQQLGSAWGKRPFVHKQLYGH